MFEFTTVEAPGLGRIVVAPAVSEGFVLFYTTLDFRGFLEPESREAILGYLRHEHGIEARLATCTQVHGTDVVFAAPPAETWRELGECDALWTNRPRVALAIKVADCLPVTLVDPEAKTIANAHSGWRGAAAGIAPRVIQDASTGAGFSAARAWAFLGPSIRQCCFEVGEEVVGRFTERYGDVTPHVDRARGKKPHFDLTGLTRRLLEEEGFAAERILDSGLCTRCEGSIFHSYRRDGASSGRVLAIAVQA